MYTETLSHRHEQLEVSNSTLTELEKIIETAAATLTPEELAQIEQPNPTPDNLRLDSPETLTTEVAFDSILKKTPEVETPPNDHTMKIAIRKENSWRYKA